MKDLTKSVQAQASHFLVPPSTTKMLDAVLDEARLTSIEEYVKARSEVLAREKFEEMEELMNEIVYQQMKKLRAQSAFVKDFEGVYALQEQELRLMREECLAERIAITKAKAAMQAQQAQGRSAATAAHENPLQVFQDNQFAISHQPELLLPASTIE